MQKPCPGVQGEQEDTILPLERLGVFLRKQPGTQNSIVHCAGKAMLEWGKPGVRATGTKALWKVRYGMVWTNVICMEKGD